MDEAVQNLQSMTSIEEPDMESYMERLDPLDQLDQELERSLEERHVALQHIHALTYMKELEARSLERQRTDVAASTSDMDELHHSCARLKRRSDLLHYNHLTSSLKLAKKLKGFTQNMDTIFEEYSDHSICQRLPELEARLLETAAERDATHELVENLRHLYLHSEPEPNPSQLALQMLTDPARLERLDIEMRSAQAALERAWFFAPSWSRKPALLDDIERQSGS